LENDSILFLFRPPGAAYTAPPQNTAAAAGYGVATPAYSTQRTGYEQSGYAAPSQTYSGEKMKHFFL